MSLLGDLVGLGGIYATGENLKDIGAGAQESMGALSDQLQGDTAFKGYSVKSGLGNIGVTSDGSVEGLLGDSGGYASGMGNLSSAAGMATAGSSNEQLPGALYQLNLAGQGTGGLQQGAYNASQQMMGLATQDPAQREQEIYNRMMSAQQPGLDRARAAMEGRAFAQGRTGVAGSQYGGSGEQFAQSRAEAEARNSAMLGAMGQAQNEMMNQGNLASSFGSLGNQTSGLMANMANLRNTFGLGQAQLQQGGAGLLGSIGSQQANLGFLPAEMQLQQGLFGLQNADVAQTGQLTGANLAAQLGLGGVQTDVNANKAASELYGNAFAAILSGNAGDSLFGGLGIF